MDKSSIVDKEDVKRGRQNLLRNIAFVAAGVGAMGSFGLMLYTGRHNKSIILILLFTGWVLSPFIALMIANRVFNRWSVFTRNAIYSLMIFISIGSLVSYSGAFNPHGTKPAFVFMIVPLVSWLLLVIVVPGAEALARGWIRDKKT